MRTRIISLGIAIILMATQKTLSSRKNGWLGLIVPIITLAFIIFAFTGMDIEVTVKSVVAFLVILAVELLIWKNERNNFYKNEEKKMKAKDIA